MSIAVVVFAVCVALIGYVYAGYPVLAYLMSMIVRRPLRWTAAPPKAVSIVVAAYNEAAGIRRRAVELLSMLDRLDRNSELIIVSDGSTDGTETVAMQVADPRLRVIPLEKNSGKAVALNAGVAAAANEVIIFADARQTWAEDAISRMLTNYADESVGAVSGDLLLQNPDGSLAGVGLYWKLEKWLRRSESMIRSSVQVSGSIASVRKALYDELPAGTILDDVYWPLGVTMKGYRVIHEPRAHAFDRLPDKPRDEMRRKVRTLAGNFQLIALRPQILLPWRNPAWFMLLCHKLLRLVVPWAMIAALVASAIAPEPWMRWMLLAQLLGYAYGALAVCWKPASRLPLSNAIASLLVLNAAALKAWFVYFSGRSNRSWRKVTYHASPETVVSGT